MPVYCCGQGCYKLSQKIELYVYYASSLIKMRLLRLGRKFKILKAKNDNGKKKSSLQEYVQEVLGDYADPYQKVALQLVVIFSEHMQEGIYEIILPNQTANLKRFYSNISPRDMADLLWKLQCGLAGKEIYPFSHISNRKISARDWVLKVRKDIMSGEISLTNFNDAKFRFELLCAVCLALKIQGKVVDELDDAVSQEMESKIPLPDKKIGAQQINVLVEAMAKSE